MISVHTGWNPNVFREGMYESQFRTSILSTWPELKLSFDMNRLFNSRQILNIEKLHATL